jgi:hypothetical protein
VPDCAVDGRPTDSANLCHGCLDALKAELRSVAWLVEQLGITLTRQARIGARNGPRGSETPLAFHLRASVDLETLRDGLGMWARAVADNRAVDAPEGDPAAWLLRHGNDIAQHPDAAELHGDVLAMTKAARATIDLPPQRHFVGPCEDCGEDLYCSTLAKVVTCQTPECGFSADVTERRIWLLEQAVDQLRTAAELSRELPWIAGVTIDRKLINQWASRGVGGLKLTPFLPHPRDPRGHTRYRLGEVIEFARRQASEVAARAVG